LKVLLHHFSKVKSKKKVTKQWKSRFFLLFLLNDRGMDPAPDPDPGGPKTRGSGFGSGSATLLPTRRITHEGPNKK
jgi:hypothetical protein